MVIGTLPQVCVSTWIGFAWLMLCRTISAYGSRYGHVEPCWSATYRRDVDLALLMVFSASVFAVLHDLCTWRPPAPLDGAIGLASVSIVFYLMVSTLFLSLGVLEMLLDFVHTYVRATVPASGTVYYDAAFEYTTTLVMLILLMAWLVYMDRTKDAMAADAQAANTANWRVACVAAMNEQAYDAGRPVNRLHWVAVKTERN